MTDDRAPDAGLRPGPDNHLTDIPGLRIGHAVDLDARSGVTVVLCDGLTRAAVDCRGGGPATRELEALAPDRLGGALHALVFSGGSVFGLAAADGVAQALSERGVGVGLRPGAPAAAIVPAACLYDLGNPGRKEWGVAQAGGEPPYRRLGREALGAALERGERETALGSVGAGRGAVAGTLKGGLGAASLDLGGGVVVAALAAVNPVGAVVGPGGAFWSWPFEIDGELGGRRPDAGVAPAIEPMGFETKLGRRLGPGEATTLCVVATTADLDRGETQRLAIMAQDGLARAIRPAHTPFDGDVVFALATADAALAPASSDVPDPFARSARLARLGSAAADCLARAIARGVYEARALPDEAPAFRSLF